LTRIAVTPCSGVIAASSEILQVLSAKVTNYSVEKIKYSSVVPMVNLFII
jgi:hypothetical protein